MNLILAIHLLGQAAIATGILTTSATPLLAGLALVAVSDITLLFNREKSI